MKIKVVSDVHSNYPALKKATEKEDGEDYRVYCGDLVGLMGFPSDTVEYIKNNYDFVVKGNHDVAVLEHNEGHVGDEELSNFECDYVNELLTEEQKGWVRSLDASREFKEDFMVAHAKPYENPAGIRKANPQQKMRYGRGLKYVSTGGHMPSDFTSLASSVNDEYKFVFLGHTHVQHSLDASKFGHDTVIVNPGSLGQNFNQDSTYSVVDTEKREVEEKTVEFPERKVRERLEKLDCPKKVV
jgi:predicted phosphodiesterase